MPARLRQASDRQHPMKYRTTSLALASSLALCLLATAQAQSLDTPITPCDALPPITDDGFVEEGGGENFSGLASRRARPMSQASTSEPGPTSTECLNLVHGAPMTRQAMDQMRGQLQDQLTRLHQLHLTDRSRQGPRATALSFYTSAGRLTRDDQADQGGGEVRLRTTALTLGADYRLNERTVVGGTLGLSQPRARWQGTGSRVDGNSTQFGLYGSYSPTEATYLSATASTAYNRYAIESDMGTGITVGTRTRSYTTGLSLQAGYDHAWGMVSVSPYARLDHLNSRLDAFSESGSQTKGRSQAVSLGLQGQWSLPQTWGVLLPHARLEWTQVTRWRMSGDSAQAYASDTGLMPVPHPIEVDRAYGQWALGVSGVLQRGLSLFADYDQGFAQRGVSQWRFSVGLRSEL
ncbi:MAG TPA: autotransporter outer membrane beta-barrel domain-containing protein [Aquabacterium sp.]|nr:autotransporter outer membrane beta-barrel domain-containing protein [Aquabacterium sp.]